MTKRPSPSVLRRARDRAQWLSRPANPNVLARLQAIEEPVEMLVAETETGVVSPSSVPTLGDLLRAAWKEKPVVPKPEPKRYDPGYLQKKYPSDQFKLVATVTPDGRLPFVFQELHCCGMKEVYGIQKYWAYRPLTDEAHDGYHDKYEPRHPAEFLQTIQIAHNTLWLRQRSFYIFSDNGGTITREGVRMGDRICEFLNSLNIGVCHAIPAAKNFNSGNRVAAYMFSPDEDQRWLTVNCNKLMETEYVSPKQAQSAA